MTNEELTKQVAENAKGARISASNIQSELTKIIKAIDDKAYNAISRVERHDLTEVMEAMQERLDRLDDLLHMTPG